MLATLSSVLDGVSVSIAHADHPGTDFIVQPHDGARIPIQVKWAGEGWPDDVRRVATGIPKPWPENLVVVAHRLSPGAIEWLRERNANWADEAGQARIVGPKGLIVIREPRLPAPQPPSFHWSPSALDVAEVLLARPDEPLRIPQLAEASGWSTPQTAAVLQGFDTEGWTAKRGPARGRGAHRVLADPNNLLMSFSAALDDQTPAARLAHRAMQEPLTFLEGELRQALDRQVDWALTGWAGLELAAPLMTVVPSLHVYVSEDGFAGALSVAMEEAGLREVAEGARVTFWRADPRTLRLRKLHDDTPVISPPRLYADLSSFGARGQDAADHVKRELIDPLHSDHG